MFYLYTLLIMYICCWLGFYRNKFGHLLDRADIIEKLEFGFPIAIGVDRESDLVSAIKNHSSRYVLLLC